MADEFNVGFDRVSDIPRGPKKANNLDTDLFQKMDQNKMVDAYEEAIGLKNPKQAKNNIKIRHILLNPGSDEEDSALLTELLNDGERYRLTFQDKTWTNRGEFKIFIIYEDNLDIKAEREKKGTTTNE